MCGVIEMASAFKFHSKDETGSDWGVVASRCLKPEFDVAWIEGIQLGVGGLLFCFIDFLLMPPEVFCFCLRALN